MCTSHSSLQLYFLRKMLFLVFFLSIFLGVSQAVWAVAACDVTSGADSGTGTLREKIGDANCDPINIKVPLITLTSSDNTSYQYSAITIARAVTINGNYATVKWVGVTPAPSPTNTNILTRVFLVNLSSSSVTVTINNIKVIGGDVSNSAASTANGGGIRAQVGTLNLQNCIVTGNKTGNQGGGVKAVVNTVNITNCTFYGNTSKDTTTGPDCHGTTSSSPSSANNILESASVSSGSGNCSTLFPASPLPIAPVGLTVNVSGGGTGKVTAAPATGGPGATLVCTNSTTSYSSGSSSPCNSVFKSGGSVTLTATEDSGSNFIKWEGDCVGGTPANTATVAMGTTTGKTCTATFDVGTTALSISSHPSSTTIKSGDPAILNVTATGGTAPYTYEWYEGATSGSGTAIPSTNSPNYTPSPNLTASKTYWVKVTDSATATFNSNPATVTVNVPPTITVQPSNTSVVTGNSTSLSVTVTTPTEGTLSYQWYQGTASTTTTSVGTNSDSFTTPNLSADTSYWVRVTNTLNSTTTTTDSSTATVSITTSATIPSITTHPLGSSIANNSTATLSVAVSGTAPLSYQWYQGTTAGDTVNSTTVGTNSSSFTTSPLTSTTSYWVKVTNSAGSTFSNLATITVAAAASAPSITVQPSNVSITSGSTATLSVSATGNPTPSYQWYQGSTAISGATSSSYTTPALTSATSYWVKVSNSLGTMDSSTATVTVNAVVPPPPPPATFGLGLKKDGTGSGKVFSDTGMECGNYCTDEFDSSKTVTLSATPDLGSVFAKFTCSSGETSSQPSLSVRMNAVKICTATFNQVPKYKLSVSTQGKATGTVTTQPTAISACGTGCFEFYEGTAVTLVPQPATGAAFTEWSSNCPDGKITIKSAGNSCTATFMPLYTLTVATAGTGLGSVTSAPTGIECGNGKTSCAKIYGEGVSVALTPTASAGFAFAGWNPECADGKVTLTSNKTCTASFMPIFTLKVAVAGAPSGKITSDPAGIECGTVCSTTVAAGNKIALIPTASELGVTFTGWSGDCVSSNVVTMDKDKQCTANFANTGTTQFSSKTVEIKEDGKHAVITVQRVSGSTGVLTSYYTTADGTAKADGDYTPTTGTLEWKDGETADKTFTIPINFDNDIEGNETLAVRLLNSSGGVRDEAVLTIVDVIVPNALQFSHPLARMNEADGKVRLTVVRAANSAGKVSVDYATQDKEAVAGQDYAEQKGTLTWESGDMERKFIEIPILDNPNKNVNTQFAVVLSNPQPATIAILGPNKSVTVSIVNTATSTAAGGSIEFSSNHYDVNESRGNIEILLKRLGSKVGTVSVLFATQDGSAVQDVDYIAKQQTVEWADGDSSDKSIILTIPYNAQPEADKVLNLTLANPSAGANLGAIDKATLRIIDSYASSTTVEPEKPQHGVIQLGANAYQAEEGSLVSLKVSRVGGNQDPVTVKYMTSNGTAKTGEDYVGRLGELTWLDKESGDKFISINLLDNTVRDADRSFTVQLLPVNNSVVSNDTATVLIKDNDNTTVQFTAASFNALENAGEATLTVSRQQGSVGDVTVYYQLQEETAKAGTDFALASGRLLWLDGDTADKSFGVKLYDNATFNANRTLKVSLHTPEGASLGVPSSATLTIQEDDSSVQPECQPKSSSVECGLDNTGKTLENVKVGATGTIQGGTLAGKIENLGTVRDVTLQPGTQLIGGNVRGTISGVNSTQLARLIAVKVAAATLRYVVIDAQSVLADDVVLGEGVLFESNATIPPVSLSQTLGMIAPPFNMTTPFAAIRLNQDVLFNSISGGIVTAINELADLKSWGLKLQQNPTTGYLETTLGNTYYAVMPIEVRHVLRQLLNGQMQSGVYMAADGSITFITYTGRWVRAIPVLHDSQAFLVGLNGFGLTQFSVFPNGNFRVPVADTGIYYSARPSLLATRRQLRDNVNLDVFNMPIAVNYGDSWQQSLYPAVAHPEAIYALSPEAVLQQDGRVILKLGTGETQHTFYGIFDYVVTPGTATQQGDSLFYQIEDKDGDGTADYRIVYPNGDGQLIFAR